MMIAIAMMPRPPIPHRRARHRSTPRGSWSRPTITVAPVVVNPDIVSKAIGIGEAEPDERYGGEAGDDARRASSAGSPP